MDECKKIKSRIKEVEEAIKKSDINLTTYDYYTKLFEIHRALWNLLYFKLHQEETFLDKVEDEK